MQDYIKKFYGKTGEYHDFHPLAYHSLDVAACAAVILERSTFWHDCLVRLHGGSSDTVIPTLITMIGLHDLGKFSSSFQYCVSREIGKMLAPDRAHNFTYGNDTGRRNHHDPFGLAIWTEFILCEKFKDHDQEKMELLASAVFGHHGTPPVTCEYHHSKFIDTSDLEDALKFSNDLLIFLAPSGLVPPVNKTSAVHLSFALAALTNLADWIGSNETWFPFTQPTMSIDEYWLVAKQRAELAITETRVIPPHPATDLKNPDVSAFAHLYPDFAPTPLQMAADKLVIKGQSMIMIEELTGGGKTEAAKTIASRLMACGHACGLIDAMPTEATTEAMADRVELIRHLLYNDDNPSMAIIHGSKRRGEGIIGEFSEWMDDERRRRLFASIAVSTIDQVLLASMKIKFMTIRLAGLMGKVLIADEVHCYDAYTSTLLVGLIRLHAAMGGSIILLSATLADSGKMRLFQAFADGAGILVDDCAKVKNPNYPSMIMLNRHGTQIVNPKIANIGTGRKLIRFVRTIEEIEALISSAVANGKCVLWSRNTVKDVMLAADRLREKHDDVIVFHSRFPQADRVRLRGIMIDRFGPNSTTQTRRGAIVIATQVIEQSLDVDFDLVIADLKPIDGLIQVAGRGGRHARDQHGNRINDHDKRGEHELVILSPDPKNVTDEAWYSRMFPRGAFVYPDTAILWRTAMVLEKDPSIEYPRNIRKLVNYVYEDDKTPEPLCRKSERAMGKELADSYQAGSNQIEIESGYTLNYGLPFGEDQNIPTRLGESVEIVVVVYGENGLRPYADGNEIDVSDGQPNFQTGRMRLRPSEINANLTQELAVKKLTGESTKDIGGCRHMIPVIIDITGRGELINGKGQKVSITVDQENGLIFDD